MRVSTIIIASALAAVPAQSHAADTRAADTAAIKRVLLDYQSAVERLSPTSTERLFAKDSAIFESGRSEGTYANYLQHHLVPELGEFRTFKFRDYKVSVRFVGPLALADESYAYRIETKTGEIAERLGVATSVLRKDGGRWIIISMHNSSRHPPV